MKAIELLRYLKDGMEIGYPPKHIINNAIKEVEELEALIDENKTLVNTLMKVYEEMIKLREENQELKDLLRKQKKEKK